MSVILNINEYLPPIWTPPQNIYGARVYKTNATTTKCIRLADAVDMEAAAQKGTTAGHSDFDLIKPYINMKMYNVIGQDITAVEGDENFKYDGTNGDVVVRHDKYYYKVENTDEYIDFYLSETKHEGFNCIPCNYDFVNNKEIDTIFISRYAVDNTYASRSGVRPIATARSTARPLIKGKGSNYFMYDYMVNFSLWLLYLVEFADTNSETTIGRGLDTANPATGGTDLLAYHTGELGGAAGTTEMCYRNIERMVSYYGVHVDGLTFFTNSSSILRPQYCLDRTKYADRTTAAIPTGYIDTGFNLGLYAGNGVPVFYKNMISDPNVDFLMLPSGVGGNANGYFASALTNYYAATTANLYGYVMRVGGVGSTPAPPTPSRNRIFSVSYNGLADHGGYIRFYWVPDGKVV